MKRRQVISAIGVGVAVLCSALAVWAYSRPLPVVHAVSAELATNAVVPTPDLAWSPYGEQAFQVVGLPLSGSNGGEKVLPTASVAKVMTALAILHQKPLAVGQQGPSVTISAADVGVYQQDNSQNQSVVPVAAGETLTEYQALQAMLIPSATNVADIMAPWAFGSLSAYLSYANNYAQQLGMTHTHFVDASGFLPGSVSTPQDLVKLGIAAMQNPVIAEIVGQSSVSLPVAGTVSNFDTALGQAGIVGIKTGNTDQAGGAFLFAAKYQGQLIVGATLGAPDLGTALHDAPELVASIESAMQTDVVVHEGTVLGTYRLPWGGVVNAIAQKDISVVDWKGSVLPVGISLQPLKPTYVIGSAGVTYNGATQTVPLILQTQYRGPSLWWRLFR